MLATLVALVLAQAAPAEEPAPPAAPAEPAPPAEEPARVGTLPPPRLEAVRPGQVSLLAGETLRGRSALLASAGWSSLGAAYAQGVSEVDDVGALVDFDWAKTELRLGALYRRGLGPAGLFHAAARLGISWYANSGGTWVYGKNDDDRGLELAPGLSLSARGAGGFFTILADAPLAITTRRGAGLIFAPRLALAFETALDRELTVGARIGAGWRTAGGEAPMRDARGELQFLVLGGWQIL